MADESPGGRRAPDPVDSRRLAGSRDYVRSLEHRSDAESLGLLVQCLSDDSNYLRELAEAALMRRGASTTDALLPLLGQGLWFTRASAARILGGLGQGAAAPGLLQLTRDRVATVAADARAALVALALAGGAARLAWELHRLDAPARLEALAGIRRLDEAAAARLEKLLRSEPLMRQSDPEALRDDAKFVREFEEGVAWEPPVAAQEAPVPPPQGDGPSSR